MKKYSLLCLALLICIMTVLIFTCGKKESDRESQKIESEDNDEKKDKEDEKELNKEEQKIESEDNDEKKDKEDEKELNKEEQKNDAEENCETKQEQQKDTYSNFFEEKNDDGIKQENSEPIIENKEEKPTENGTVIEPEDQDISIDIDTETGYGKISGGN